ncbi:MAG: MlaD family protein [Syntrophorhabdaceae bacterium]
MSKPVNKTMIGLFVVVAIGLVVAAVLILGSGKLFKDKPKFVMYFEGSVKGLAVGSSVVFRGVKIGTVTEIGMLFNRQNLSVLIPVYVELGEADVEMMGDSPGSIKRSDRKKMVYEYTEALIKRGIRAQLEMQSFVTGQLQIALDFFPDKPAKFVGGPSKYPEIPTIPTQLQELTKRVEQLPIEDIAKKLSSTLEGIDKMVNSPQMTRMVESLGQTSEEAKKLMRDMNRQMGPLTLSLKDTSDQAGITLKKIHDTAQNFENTAGSDSVIVYKLDRTLNELERTSRSLRFLAETLEEQPESLLFGKKNPRGGAR